MLVLFNRRSRYNRQYIVETIANVTFREARLDNNSPLCYSQVVVYLYVYTWRVAIIRPIVRTSTSRFGAVRVKSSLGPMFYTNITDIKGPTGFISKQVNSNDVTYIVSEAEEYKLFLY